MEYLRRDHVNKIFWHTHNQGVSFWVHWLHALWPCRRLCWWRTQSCCAGPLRCDLWWTVLTFLFNSEIRKMTAKLDLVSLQRCVFPRFYKNTLTRHKLLSLIRFEPATKSTGTNSHTSSKKKEGKLDLTSKNVTTRYAVTNLEGRTELLLANITNTTLAPRAETGNIEVWRYKTTVGKCHSYQSGQLRGFRQKISPVSQLEPHQYRPFKRKQTGSGKHRQTSLRLDLSCGFSCLYKPTIILAPKPNQSRTLNRFAREKYA